MFHKNTILFKYKSECKCNQTEFDDYHFSEKVAIVIAEKIKKIEVFFPQCNHFTFNITDVSF